MEKSLKWMAVFSFMLAASAAALMLCRPASAGEDGSTAVVQMDGAMFIDGLKNQIKFDRIEMDAQGRLHVILPEKQDVTEVNVNQCYEDLQTLENALNAMPEIMTESDYFAVLRLEALRDSVMSKCMQSEEFAASLSMSTTLGPRCSPEEIKAFCSFYCTFLQSEYSYETCMNGWLFWSGCVAKTTEHCTEFWKEWDKKHPPKAILPPQPPENCGNGKLEEGEQCEPPFSLHPTRSGVFCNSYCLWEEDIMTHPINEQPLY